ncbi:uncharacterized protein LTHEOB_12682 [Neofusicoccum parvum]|uniref:Uncharacterized protein LTHEOB_12682 n=1 Tax=Neofusicoccum parvum TaxID=310453 RepID=A0ACB5RXJ3_9PEZI|nr:uncharacterized protein LTHEOB_12682 [Neofusicoccum parvum]
MPPIPVYSDAPINPQTAATKPDGTTPQTAQPPQQQPQPTPTRTTATTTAAAFDPSSAPPPPQPGAVPMPPTQNHSPPANPSSHASPAPPQPGAAPVPAPTGSAPRPTVTKNVVETVTTGPPPQFAIPPPTLNAGATHSTTIHLGGADGGVAAGGRARGSSSASLEHPPGYVQNPYAADGTAAQRAALEDARERDRAEEGVWGGIKAVAGKVGESLKKADQEAWRLVGGGGGK